MAWHHPGDKPLSEPMVVRLLTHICVTRPQWVNPPSVETGIFQNKVNTMAADALATPLEEDKYPFILCGQYHGCWCPGSLCRQGISSHGIDHTRQMGTCLSLREDFNSMPPQHSETIKNANIFSCFPDYIQQHNSQDPGKTTSIFEKLIFKFIFMSVMSLIMLGDVSVWLIIRTSVHLSIIWHVIERYSVFDKCDISWIGHVCSGQYVKPMRPGRISFIKATASWPFSLYNGIPYTLTYSLF